MNGNNPLYARLDGGEAYPIEESIWEAFFTVAKEKPDHVAVISRSQPSNLLESVVGKSHNWSSYGLEWTYSHLVQGAVNVASVFKSHRVKRGSTLLAFLPPICAEWSLLWWAANLHGVTLVTIDKRALEPARSDELSFYIRSLQPEIVANHGGDGTGAVNGVCTELQHFVKCKVTLDSVDAAPGWRALASFDFSESNIKRANDRCADYDRTAVILYTSGTSTGQPKGCPLTGKNLVLGWSVQNPATDKHIGIPSRIVMMFANSRAINLHMCSQCWLVGGTIIYLSTGFTPEGVLSTIEQERITAAIFIPPMLSALVKCPTFSKNRVQSMVRVFVGGDIVTANIQDLVIHHFVNARVVSAYAMTEGLWVVGWPLSNAPEHIPVCRGLLAQGSILPGNLLKIVGDKGNTVRRRETGDIYIRSPAMISQYRGNVAPDTFHEDNEGRWFKTGDTGFIDDDALLYVMGRKKDIIKRIGVPVPPILLENVLATFGGVRQASVFGLPSAKLGEEIVAVVSSLAEIKPQKLKDLVVEHLGPDYAVGKVFALQDLGMQEFPVNVTGKVMKIELRKAVEDLNPRK
ncbi:acetyl-CoA synthetase-like protein [Aureobasidium subglaciale]|nr:acetyl-CoA synthetase-like protein [Aureobasidium subglaciale]